MKHYLVLGGTGFLGKNLCHRLAEKGNKITVVGKHTGEMDDMSSMFNNISVLSLDFSIVDSFKDLLKGVDTVFHLISTTNPSNVNMVEEFSDNVLPTVKFLDACRNYDVKVVYFSSGGTVYGIPTEIPINELHPTEPISPYGIQKLSIEKCLEYYGRTYGLRYCILRISNPYGAYQKPTSVQGVVAVFLCKAIHGDEITIWGDGSIVRDYVYVDDVMDACLAVDNYIGKQTVFNVGSGIGYSLTQVVDLIQNEIGVSVKIKYLPGRIQDVPINILDNRRMMEEVAWKPKISLTEGIHRMKIMWNEEKYAFINGR